MMRRSWPLNRALDFLRRMRPEAQPNAGYLAALLKLEEELFGRQTVKVRLVVAWHVVINEGSSAFVVGEGLVATDFVADDSCLPIVCFCL
jgi:hypothetical protein